MPTDRFYRLSMGTPSAVFDTPPLEGTLEVERFNASGVLQDRAIVFAEEKNPNVMQRYKYQLWEDPPTLMLQAATVDYLREVHLADQVVTTGLRIEPRYTLTGYVKKLEHVVGSSSGVLVELEYRLRDYERGDLVWVKTYTVRQPVQDASVAVATEAFAAAVQKILADLTADLARR